MARLILRFSRTSDVKSLSAKVCEPIGKIMLLKRKLFAAQYITILYYFIFNMSTQLTTHKLLKFSTDKRFGKHAKKTMTNWKLPRYTASNEWRRFRKTNLFDFFTIIADNFIFLDTRTETITRDATTSFNLLAFIRFSQIRFIQCRRLFNSNIYITTAVIR